MLLSAQLEVSAFAKGINKLTGSNGALMFRYFGITVLHNGIHDEFNLVGIHDGAFTDVRGEWCIPSAGVKLGLCVIEESLAHCFSSGNWNFTVFHIYAHQRHFKHVVA